MFFLQQLKSFYILCMLAVKLDDCSEACYLLRGLCSTYIMYLT